MPVKKLKSIMFKFTHNGKSYFFNTWRIFNSCDEYICDCDLTATNYYGNEEVMKICCKIALDAYFEGKANGKIDAKREIREVLGLKGE